MPHSLARARTISRPWWPPGWLWSAIQGPPLSSISMRTWQPGWTVARTVKVPPGRREWLCRAALAASSEAQRITLPEALDGAVILLRCKQGISARHEHGPARDLGT